MNATPRQTIPVLVNLSGVETLCADPERFRTLLQETCGLYALEVRLLVSSARAKIPQEMQARAGLGFGQTANGLIDRLQTGWRMREKDARWVVETWGLALGLLADDDCTTPDTIAPDLEPGMDAPAGSAGLAQPAVAGTADPVGLAGFLGAVDTGRLRVQTGTLLPPELRRKLAVWRDDLLDFSRGNPLLYDGAGMAGLEILEPGLVDLFQRLVRQGERLAFTPLRVVYVDAPRGDGSAGHGFIHARREGVGDLRADLEGGALFERLGRLRGAARACREELGVNALYMGLGLLRWTDLQFAGQVNAAPLLLAPVHLRRAAGSDSYCLEYEGEGLALNPALAAFLASRRPGDRVDLPELPSDPDFEAAAYLAALEMTAAGRGWRIERRAVLRILPAHTVRAARDLFDAQRLGAYPEVVRRLAGETLSGPTPASTPGWPDTPGGPGVEEALKPEESFPVLPAEAAQLRVLELARAAGGGRDLIIDTPAGTDAAQTAANLAAQAILEHRTVLVICQKQAVLDQVQRLLAQTGLDLACLEAQPQDNHAHLMEELQRAGTILRGTGSLVQPQVYRHYASLRRQLNELARELNQPRGAWGISIQQALGMLLQSEPAAAFAAAGAPVLPDLHPAMLVSREEWETIEAAVRRAGAAAAQLGCPPEEHPWRFAFRYAGQFVWQSAQESNRRIAEESNRRIAEDSNRRPDGLDSIGDPESRSEGMEGQAAGSGLLQALGEAAGYETVVGVLLSELETRVGLPRARTLAEMLWVWEAAQRTADAPDLLVHWLDETQTAALANGLAEGERNAQVVVNGKEWLDQSMVRLDLLEQDIPQMRDFVLATIKSLGDIFSEPESYARRAQRADVLARLREASQIARKNWQVIQNIRTALGCGPITRISALEKTGRVLELAARLDKPLPAWFASQAGQPQPISTLAEELHAALAAYSAVRAGIRAQWSEEVLAADPAEVRQVFKGQYARSARWLVDREYVKWTKRTVGYWTGTRKAGLTEFLTLAAGIDEYHQRAAWFEEHHAACTQAFGQRWRGAATRGDLILEQLDIIRQIEALMDGQIPDRLRDSLTAGEIPPARWVEWQTQIQAVRLSTLAITRAIQPLLTRNWMAQIGTDEEIQINHLLYVIKEAGNAFGNLNLLLDTLYQFIPDRDFTFDQLLAVLRICENVRSSGQILKDKWPDYMALFGNYYRGTATRWEELRAALRYAGGLARFLRAGEPEHHRRPAGADLAPFLAHFADFEQLRWTVRQLARPLGLICERMVASLGVIEAGLERLDAARPIAEIYDLPLVEMFAWARAMMGQGDRLAHWLEYGAALAGADELGVRAFVLDALGPGRGQEASADLGLAARRSFWQQWLKEAYQDGDEVKSLHSGQHAQKSAEFGEADRHLLELQRKKVLRAWQAGMPAVLQAPLDGQTALLARELKKQSGWLSARGLFGRVPDLLLKLKPAVLMSPAAAAELLPLENFRERFDMVIFLEASQLRTACAVGGLLRGRQVIVMGDARGLPPGPGGGHTVPGRAVPGLNSGPGGGAGWAAESLLEAFARLEGIERAGLTWQSAGRAEAPLAFSNRHFYEGKLVAAPAVERGIQPDAGAGSSQALVRVEVLHGLEDAGQPGVNWQEAWRAVVLAGEILEETHGSQSLGILTFSAAQEWAVRDMLQFELARGADERLARWRSALDEDANVARPFYIKTLDHAAGEDRDAIILSCGYGPGADGTLNTDFGAVGQPGGERLLNAGLTRARRQTVVLCSFQPQELDLVGFSAPGLSVLRKVLEDYGGEGLNERELTGPVHGITLPGTVLPGTAHVHAEDPGLQEHGQVVADRTGPSLQEQGLPEQAVQSLESRDPFENYLAGLLEEWGYTVDRGVGSGDLRVDLAVRDPYDPRRYRVGILTDGKNHARLRGARDRECLLQERLEALGWQISRQWARDWSLKPRQARKVLRAWVDAAVATPPDKDSLADVGPSAAGESGAVG